MSETSCEIIIYHEDRSKLEVLVPLFTDSGSQMPEFNGYDFGSSNIFDRVIIANIIGSSVLDTEAFLEHLKKLVPEWLYFSTFHSQEGSRVSKCFKNNKRSSKKKLLEDIRERSTETDLFFAFENNETLKIKKIIKSNLIDINTNFNGISLLFRILLSGSSSLLKLAVSRGADINFRCKKDQRLTIKYPSCTHYEYFTEGMTLLALAIQLDKKNIFDFLLKSDVDVNLADKNGKAPIHADQSKYVVPLIKAGADVNAENHDKYEHGRTPIFSANDDQTLKLLLEAGADINHMAKDGYTPILRALRYESSIAWCKKLISYGANIHKHKKGKVNALWAVLGKNNEFIDFVKSYGIDTYEIPDDYYKKKTYMGRVFASIKKNDVESLAQFIKDKKYTKEEQISILFKAIEKGKLRTVKIIIENGIAPFLQSSGRGCSTRIFAHQKAKDEGHIKIAKYLKEKIKPFEKKANSYIAKAKPAYDIFMTEYISLIKQKNEDWSSLIPLVSEIPNSSYIRHWSRLSPPMKSPIKVKVDDEYNITFLTPYEGENFDKVGYKVIVRSQPHFEIISFGRTSNILSSSLYRSC